MQTPPEKALSVQIHKSVEYLSTDIQMQISKLMGKFDFEGLKISQVAQYHPIVETRPAVSRQELHDSP